MALFAALIGPWFINWDTYRSSFEREATRILGHPVHVDGSARASILPAPSLSFTNVSIDGADGETVATVDRFEVTIELLPLIQGEIHVTSMRLAKPHLVLTAAGDGSVDWLQNRKAGGVRDPDKVVLTDVRIEDGTLEYRDAARAIDLTFGGISAGIEASSLAGPWRVDGTYLDDGAAAQFHLATGRALDDGSIRVKANVNPARWPLDISADGALAIDPAKGVTYGGTFNTTALVAAAVRADGGPASAVGWSAEGAFALTREGLAIDKAVLSLGAEERPTSLAGTLDIAFRRGGILHRDRGSQAARPRPGAWRRSHPAGQCLCCCHGLVAWVRTLPTPPIPGSVSFNVPAIVVGGAIVQDVKLDASTIENGWQVSAFRARLPGQATFTADGLLATERQVSFAGTARFAALQPAGFASWWRGGEQRRAGEAFRLRYRGPRHRRAAPLRRQCGDGADRRRHHLRPSRLDRGCAPASAASAPTSRPIGLILRR